MGRNDVVRSNEIAELPPLWKAAPKAGPTRTIVIRQASAWLSLALLCLMLLLLAVVLLGQRALGSLDRQREEQSRVIAGFERKVQQLESGVGFDARRRRLLLGMRDHILKVNPRVSLGDAYRYAELALNASEKYPSVDPLLLLAIGTVESRYETNATSSADARGLYQIWPSTGRLLLRGLGWQYDDATLYDPEKNTEAAALYLDILFSTYTDPALVLAEYNGGPLNAGYFRARVGQLAAETRNYVPQVLALHERLTRQFAQPEAPQLQFMHLDAHRQGKTLAGAIPAGTAAVQPVTPARR
jgi:hypothetical protein